MPKNAANVPEDTLESPLNSKAFVDATGLHVQIHGVVGDVFAVDASGNVVATGSLAAVGVTNTGAATRTVTNAITAGTTQTQGGATAMTTDYNRITVCANANDGVKLPAATIGRTVEVTNAGAQTAKVYPATGDDLGAGANTATTQATTVTNRYVCYAANTWQKV